MEFTRRGANLGRECFDRAAAWKKISTIVDEPFVFQAAYNFIQKEDEGFYKHFKVQYRDLPDPLSEGKIFVRNTPFDQIYAFHKKRLIHELFSIPKAAPHQSTTKLKTPIPQFEPYLSLIYVHPTIEKTPREGWGGDDLWDAESETGTDRNEVFMDSDSPLMQLLMTIDGSNMRRFVPGGVVDLLDSVKGIKRVCYENSLKKRKLMNKMYGEDFSKQKSKKMLSALSQMPVPRSREQDHPKHLHFLHQEMDLAPP
ncbi:hypothetical protein BGX28_003026 [Mortierella sp. GBA30]|nr:hypothetical protein BGX28_003026 [Mortierella sp. GBA30]